MDQKLSELVEELTTSGEPQVNPKKMKELKKICKYVISVHVLGDGCLSKPVTALGDRGAPPGSALPCLSPRSTLCQERTSKGTRPGRLPRALQRLVVFWVAVPGGGVWHGENPAGLWLVSVHSRVCVCVLEHTRVTYGLVTVGTFDGWEVRDHSRWALQDLFFNTTPSFLPLPRASQMLET